LTGSTKKPFEFKNLSEEFLEEKAEEILQKIDDELDDPKVVKSFVKEVTKNGVEISTSSPKAFELEYGDADPYKPAPNRGFFRRAVRGVLNRD
jgi:hypothetical protein